MARTILESLTSLAEPLKVLSDALAQPRAPSLAWKPSIDIVIPHHRGLWTKGEPKHGLTMTVASCEAELYKSGLDYSYTIVSNGNPTSGDEKESFDLFVDYLNTTGHVGRVIEKPEPMSPPSARNLGAAAGNAELVFFFDDHVNVKPGFFKNVLNTFDVTSCAAVFGTLHGLSKRPGFGFEDLRPDARKVPAPAFHHILTLEQNFWGNCSDAPYAPFAYRCASANHGGFGIRRKVWNEVGGYWDGFVGWGGEEIELNMKLNMLDHAIYLNPLAETWHHFPPEPTYSRPEDQTWCNFLNFVSGASLC